MRIIKAFVFILVTILFSKITCAEPNKALSQRYIPKLNTYVSFLGLGTVELGRDWGIDKEVGVHPTEDQAENLLKTIISQGINVVDTATSYQLSEERIGKYIPQDKYAYLLITKPGEHSIYANDSRCKKPSYDNIYCRTPGAAYDFSRQGIVKDVYDSLKLLKVKTIDVVLLHLDSSDAEAVLKKGEALDALKDLRKEGKIKYIGVSINGPPALYAVKNCDIDVIELEYNLLNQTNEKTMALAHQKGIGVIVRGGLGTGMLTPMVKQHINKPNLPFGPQIKALLKLVDHDYDKLTALELGFLFENPNISSVIIGADKPEFMVHDIELLNNFNDPALIAKAKHVMKKFPEPKDFTEIMGEYFADAKI